MFLRHPMSFFLIVALLFCVRQVWCFQIQIKTLNHKIHPRRQLRDNDYRSALIEENALNISPEGQNLAAFIDSLDVENLWRKKQHVSWFSGMDNHASATFATHCSALTAAVGERMGVPLLRPPNHGQSLLANAQHTWLEGLGTELGWVRTNSPVEAQAAANVGMLALVSKANLEPSQPGHAAVVRPNAAPSIAFLLENGPQVAQAGSINSANLTANKGFKPLKTSNVFYAYFDRQVAAPNLNYTTWISSSKSSDVFLFDASQSGRLDAIRLSYSLQGMPTWSYADAGIGPQNNSAWADWYIYYRYDGSKGEPFDVKRKGSSSFVFKDENIVMVDNDTKMPEESSHNVDGITGLWYANIDAYYLGLFIAKSNTSSIEGYWLAYDEDNKLPGSYQFFTANWENTGDHSLAKATGRLQKCTLSSPLSNSKKCTTTSHSFGLEITQFNAIITGLPGKRHSDVFQKATVINPSLGPLFSVA